MRSFLIGEAEWCKDEVFNLEDAVPDYNIWSNGLNVKGRWVLDLANTRQNGNGCEKAAANAAAWLVG